MSETVTVKREVEFQVPTVPNYIIHVVPPGYRQDGFNEAPKTDIADLTGDEIEAIGQAWIAALRARATVRKESRR